MSSNALYQAMSPVGRLVQGSCFVSKSTDKEGRPLVWETGENAGQKRAQFFFAIAILKTDPGWPAVEQGIKAAGKLAWPLQFNPDGSCKNPAFAYKIVDGDGTIPNEKGHAPKDREGFPGCWIMKFTTSYAPAVWDRGASNRLEDPKSIKTGDYIRVNFNVASNGSASKPGLFLNPNLVEFIAYGTEISVGIDAAAIIAANPVGQLPPGATVTPSAPPATTPPPPPATTTPPPPATDFLKMYTYNGVAYTKDQLLASGWQEAQIEKLA